MQLASHRVIFNSYCCLLSYYFLPTKFFFMKTFLLSLIFLSASFVSIAQSEKMMNSDIRCKTFKVNIGCCGISISTDLTVCCGCNMIHVCGCYVEKNSTKQQYDGYIIVDDILKNNKLETKTLNVKGSDTVTDATSGVSYTITPDTYPIISDDEGHKMIVVKVTGQ